MDTKISELIILIGGIAIGAGTFVKVLVDMTRIMAQSVKCIKWLSPVLALSYGIVVVFMLFLASGTVFSWQMVGTAILAGILAGGSAMGITELQKKAQ